MCKKTKGRLRKNYFFPIVPLGHIYIWLKA